MPRGCCVLRGRTPPSQGWKTFLRNHADGIAAVDFLVVPTLSFERLFAFVILGVSRRNILWIGVTANPTAQWLAHQITEAFPWDTAPTFLIRDNDCAYGEVFARRVRSMGIRDRPIAPRSPWQNGYVERAIGSIRRECLDHMMVWSEAHLQRVLKECGEIFLPVGLLPLRSFCTALRVRLKTSSIGIPATPIAPASARV